MNKIMLTLVFIGIYFTVSACPVCERQQPKLLRGIIHGSGPNSNWDYVIVWFVGLIALWALFLTIKWVIKPGEKNMDHIKYSILNNDQ
ncbi:MAG: hypothetical protein M3Q56_07455 [Bacteroidota bacterium]|nr:hypothetical protein [Bacteroidota bacterium]